MTSIVILPVTTIVACVVTTIVKSKDKEKRGSKVLPLFLVIGLSCYWGSKIAMKKLHFSCK